MSHTQHSLLPEGTYLPSESTSCEMPPVPTSGIPCLPTMLFGKERTSWFATSARWDSRTALTNSFGRCRQCARRMGPESTFVWWQGVDRRCQVLRDLQATLA